MAKKDEIQTSGNNPVAVLRSYLAADSIKKRFEDMLGKRAPAFTNGIINVFRTSDKLQKCTVDSICSAAIRAATFNLPIDTALGFAAIVPYGKQANFQLMYKGVTQLCIRTNQYKTIHCSEVYSDELDYFNPITGEVTFKDPKTYKLRDKGGFDDVVGHYAHFELLSGFIKSDYMTTKQAMAHGKKYSKAYQYDLRDKKKTSIWSTDPVVMCNKTILLRLLTKYGIMSMELQQAIVEERATFEDADKAATDKIQEEAGSQPIDAEAEPSQPADEQPDPENWEEDPK